MDDGLSGFPPAWAERAVTDAGQLSELEQTLAGADRVAVIVGSSISGLVLAARLGAIAKRHKGFSVVLVAGAAPVRRRLVAGCSLRLSTIRRMARSMPVDDAVFFHRLGGRAAAFRRLAVARAEPGSAPPRLIARRTDAAADPYVGLSTRHGAILAALRASLDPAGDVVVIDADVPRGQPLDGDRALPLVLKGEEASLCLPAGRAVVLNATPRADLLRPGARLPDPARYVVAVQAPLRTAGGRPWCGDDVGLAPMRFGPPAPHLAFFTPFRDPDTPEATWYGINTMTLPAARLEAEGPAAVTAAVWDRLVELEAQLGFAELDPDETRADAVVPVVRDTGLATERALGTGPPVVDVHRSFTSGAPAINVDGMLAAVVGADAFAAAFTAGNGGSGPASAARAALTAADRALRPVRWRNLGTEWLFFQAPEAVRAAAARNPYLGWKAFVLDWAHLAARGGRTR